MGSSSSSQYAFSHLETGKSNKLVSYCEQKCHGVRGGNKSLLREPLCGEEGKKLILLSTCPSICSLCDNSSCPNS